MWIKYSEKYEDHLIKKKTSHKVKLTTYIKGTDKNNVLDDCLKKGMIECHLMQQIIDLHYKLMKKYNLEDLDFDQIKKQLL